MSVNSNIGKKTEHVQPPAECCSVLDTVWVHMHFLIE